MSLEGGQVPATRPKRATAIRTQMRKGKKKNKNTKAQYLTTCKYANPHGSKGTNTTPRRRRELRRVALDKKAA